MSISVEASFDTRMWPYFAFSRISTPSFYGVAFRVSVFAFAVVAGRG